MQQTRNMLGKLMSKVIYSYKQVKRDNNLKQAVVILYKVTLII